MKTMKTCRSGSLAAALFSAIAAALSAHAVTVNSVSALQSEIANATNGKEIIIAAGTYNLADATAMNAEGHLYVTKRITLRGATGNPTDVVLVGSGNRILFMANGTTGSSISGITFTKGSRSTGRGGAINFRASNDATTVSNCVFEGNQAVDGGAVADYYTYNAAGSNRGGIVSDCLFTNNTATTSGGAGYNISLFQRCTFVDNKAATYGATVSASLSACTNRHNVATGNNYSECNVTYAQDCLFEDMECNYAAFTSCGFNRCRFRNATSGSLFATQLHMTNSIIEGCSPAEGKYIYLVYNMSGMEMINCNVVSNTFRYFKQGGSNVRNGYVVNSLFYGNKYGNAVVDMDANVTSCVAGFTNCVYSVAPANEADYAPGENNFNYNGQVFDPGFVGAKKDPVNPYALGLKSPLTTTYHGLVMDWMADATDIRGEGYPRLREGKVDIGCYQCWLNPRGTHLTFR